MNVNLWDTSAYILYTAYTQHATVININKHKHKITSMIINKIKQVALTIK